MTSVVFTTVSKTLRDEFSKVQEGLKDVESSIRRLTGRQPDSRVHDVRKRVNPDSWNDSVKRKKVASFIRQDSPPEATENEAAKKPALMSTIVTKAPAVKPIKCVSEPQDRDCKGLARNKRMFGMILGTLQKFQTEESRRSSAMQRREQIEKKLDQEAEEERANVKKERTELFKELRDKQAMERKLQLKIERVESQEQWEKSQAPLSSFIQTKAKPCLFYLPKKMTPESEKRLKDTKDKYRMIIAEKRAKVQKDLNDIETLYQKETAAAIDDPDSVVVVVADDQTSDKVTANEPRINPEHAEHESEPGKVEHSANTSPTQSTGEQENAADNVENHEVGENFKEEEAGSTTPDGTGTREFEPNYDE